VRIGSSRAAVDYPKASSLALACYTCVRGPAGGVGESYSVDCLTDVPELWQVRHRRKTSPECLEEGTFSELRPMGFPDKLG
jgi:hypothetical protein